MSERLTVGDGIRFGIGLMLSTLVITLILAIAVVVPLTLLGGLASILPSAPR